MAPPPQSQPADTLLACRLPLRHEPKFDDYVLLPTDAWLAGRLAGGRGRPQPDDASHYHSQSSGRTRPDTHAAATAFATGAAIAAAHPQRLA